MVDVVLMEPITSGNVGAIARVMKNFGFENLVLIDPKCNHLDLEGVSRAKHAGNIMENAKVVSSSVLDEYDYVIGTTARLGGYYNIPRSPLNPEQLSEKVMELKNSKIALLFGRENDGLSNEEVSKCDFLVTVPTHPKYSVMNLSHSVAVLLYELHASMGEEKIGEAIVPIDKKHKEILVGLVDETLDKMHFQTEQKRDKQKVLWRRVIGKSMLTKREAETLMGFMRRVK